MNVVAAAAVLALLTAVLCGATYLPASGENSPDASGVIVLKKTPELRCPYGDCATELSFRFEDYRIASRLRLCVGECGPPADDVIFGQADCLAVQTRLNNLPYDLSLDPFSLEVRSVFDVPLLRIRDTGIRANEVPATAPERAYFELAFTVPDASRCTFSAERILPGDIINATLSPFRMAHFFTPIHAPLLHCPFEDVGIFFVTPEVVSLSRVSYTDFVVRVAASSLDLLLASPLVTLPFLVQCRHPKSGILRPPFVLSTFGVVLDAESPNSKDTLSAYVESVRRNELPADLLIFDEANAPGGATPWERSALYSPQYIMDLRLRLQTTGTGLLSTVYPVIGADTWRIFDTPVENLITPQMGMADDGGAALFTLTFESWYEPAEAPRTAAIHSHRARVHAFDLFRTDDVPATYIRHLMEEQIERYKYTGLVLRTSSLVLDCRGVSCPGVTKDTTRPLSCSGPPPETAPPADQPYRPCFLAVRDGPLPYNAVVGGRPFHEVWVRYHQRFVLSAREASQNRPLFVDSTSPVGAPRAILLRSTLYQALRSYSVMGSIGSLCAVRLFSGNRGASEENLMAVREAAFGPTLYLGRMIAYLEKGTYAAEMVRVTAELHYWLLPTILMLHYSAQDPVPYRAAKPPQVDPVTLADTGYFFGKDIFIATSVPFELPNGLWYLFGSADAVYTGRIDSLPLEDPVLPFFVRGRASLLFPAHTPFAPDITLGPVDTSDWLFPFPHTPAARRSTDGAPRISPFRTAVEAISRLRVRVFVNPGRVGQVFGGFGCSVYVETVRDPTFISIDITAGVFGRRFNLTIDPEFVGIDLVIASQLLPERDFNITGPVIAWQRQEAGIVIALPFNSTKIVISPSSPEEEGNFPLCYTLLFSILIVVLAASIVLLMLACRSVPHVRQEYKANVSESDSDADLFSDLTD